MKVTNNNRAIWEGCEELSEEEKDSIRINTLRNREN